jgi:hypothetical protein
MRSAHFQMISYIKLQRIYLVVVDIMLDSQEYSDLLNLPSNIILILLSVVSLRSTDMY